MAVSISAGAVDNAGMKPDAMPDYDAILAAPFGAIGVRLQGEAVAGLEFLSPEVALRPCGSAAIHRVAHELEAYYADPRHVWKLTLAPAGTLFRQRVWQALTGIPCGRTRTYGEIAIDLDSSPRAIGQAVGDNPIPIVIPCHRVLAAHGLGGFMHGVDGFSMSVKRWLLHHEGVEF